MNRNKREVTKTSLLIDVSENQRLGTSAEVADGIFDDTVILVAGFATELDGVSVGITGLTVVSEGTIDDHYGRDLGNVISACILGRGLGNLEFSVISIECDASLSLKSLLDGVSAGPDSEEIIADSLTGGIIDGRRTIAVLLEGMEIALGRISECIASTIGSDHRGKFSGGIDGESSSIIGIWCGVDGDTGSCGDIAGAVLDLIGEADLIEVGIDQCISTGRKCPTIFLVIGNHFRRIIVEEIIAIEISAIATIGAGTFSVVIIGGKSIGKSGKIAVVDIRSSGGGGTEIGGKCRIDGCALDVGHGDVIFRGAICHVDGDGVVAEAGDGDIDIGDDVSVISAGLSFGHEGVGIDKFEENSLDEGKITCSGAIFTLAILEGDFIGVVIALLEGAEPRGVDGPETTEGIVMRIVCISVVGDEEIVRTGSFIAVAGKVFLESEAILTGSVSGIGNIVSGGILEKGEDIAVLVNAKT